MGFQVVEIPKVVYLQQIASIGSTDLWTMKFLKLCICSKLPVLGLQTCGP